MRHATRIRAAIVLFLIPPVTATAQDVIGGKYHKFTIVGRAGLGEVTDTLVHGPSINDQGQVAFAGRAGAFNAVFVSNVASSTPLKIKQENTFSFLGGIKIANNGHFVAMDASTVVDAEGFRQNFLRNYDSAIPNSGTLVAGASNPVANDFKQIYFPASINGSDLVVFSALRRTGPTSTTNSLITGTRPSFMWADLAVPLNPMIAADGRVVVRAGNTPTSPIRLYDLSLSTSVDIASVAMNFTALGASPDISDNGQVVVFYGNRPLDPVNPDYTAEGEGIYASIDVGGGLRRLFKVAGRPVEDMWVNPGGDGVCDRGDDCVLGELGFDPARNPLHFAAFDPNARVGVTHLPSGAPGMADDTFVVSFIATPNRTSGSAVFSGNQGLWTVRVDIKPVGPDLVEKPSGPQPVIQIGDRLGSRTVTAIRVYDPIAGAATDDTGAPRTQRRGDHRIAFGASTDAGNIVVRASYFDSDEDTRGERTSLPRSII